jgi:hypothetical protein
MSAPSRVEKETCCCASGRRSSPEDTTTPPASRNTRHPNRSANNTSATGIRNATRTTVRQRRWWVTGWMLDRNLVTAGWFVNPLSRRRIFDELALRTARPGDQLPTTIGAFPLHAEHGRVIDARLTKRGRQTAGPHQTVFGIEERMLSEMTAAGRRRLSETLRQLVENLRTS